MDELIKIIEASSLSDEEKQLLFDQLKVVKKSLAVAEFKYSRTLIDKSAITNVLNASLAEMEVQKKKIEEARNEISLNLIELDKQKKLTDRQASLDRVRAEIASMRTMLDLDRIIPLIWKELTALGIPFVRCGLFIMDDEQEQFHTFLSTHEGKSIGAFYLPYSTANLSDMVQRWHEKKSYISHWVKENFEKIADTLVEQGSIASREQYLSTVPEQGLYLHYLPFLQGILYVGNSTELNKDDIQLVQALAEAFSTAYARYEDFNKLDVAKQQVENTLTELKQAQQLLVQTEKMASLGELTAGIAHEIQNPLNFVNNFSEVNTELLAEMKVEIEKGNLEEVKALANDIIDNSQKITHHGKRAGGIVTAMLQHSRTSTGKREPTDIKSLADEYLRLAYHGLRAKDKSFNAEMKTDFDPAITTLNVVAQDLSRVILNLITNAFHAVAERAKQNPLPLKDGTTYQPSVTVTTKKFGHYAFISIRDNGTGIPQKVIDKIFQPFFTTKPTGQGTGLGLSLAYDITKAHGGELKVHSKEGEGSEFIVQLPMSGL